MNLQRLVLGCVVSFLLQSTCHAEDLKVFFGLMHGHTSYSDGSGTPDEAFTMAEAAGVDFMAITEHNHNKAAGDDGIFLTPQLYGKLIEAAKNHSVEDKFLAIYGQEFSTISSGNHANIFYAGEISNVDAGDFKTLYETWLPAHPEVPFIQFNHPDAKADQNPNTAPKKRNNDYGIDDYDKDFDELVANAGKYTALIELIIGPAFSDKTDKSHHNGQHERDYMFYLNKGFRLAPSAGQDNHKKTWGVATSARIGVWAEKLSEDAIISAIQNRRCYASEDENIEVKFTCDGKMMGSSVIPGDSSSVKLEVTVKDPDEPDAKHRVQLYYDDALGGDVAERIESQDLGEGEVTAQFHHIPELGGYYFAKVTQTGDGPKNDVWTAPIWIGDGGPSGPARATRLAASNTDDPQRQEVRWQDAPQYVGHEVAVKGKVIRTFNFRDKAVFFNFDEDYENTLSLVLLKSDFDAFGGAEGIEKLQKKLMNMAVRVKGAITLYENERVQLRLTKSDQILTVTEDEPEEDDAE